MKKLYLAFMVFAATVCNAIAEPATVFSTADTAADTLVTNAVALLVVVIAIPIAFAGYRVIRRVMAKA